MLVLSRKRGESIIINGNIKVTILENLKSQVKVGILAPKGTPIDREEIHEQKMATQPKG